MQKGTNPSSFRVTAGEDVIIRVRAIGMGQFETVGGLDLMGDEGEGNAYLSTIEGNPGDIKHIVINFNFPDKQEPSGKYEVTVESPGGEPTFKAPTAYQPLEGDFPQSVTNVLEFVI